MCGVTTLGDLPITPDGVAEAAQRIEGVANRTPIFTSRDLDDQLGARVFLKGESFQRGGAFKFRGAYNAVASLSPQELRRGVVASSSGNHAQALAIAARLAGSQATIFMPEDAPTSKRTATQAYGARVIPFDRYADDREQLVQDLAEREGLMPVHPYDDVRVMAGAGTSTRELLEQTGGLDVVMIPAGGGGQLAGGAVAAAGAPAPPPEVFGVEPEAVGQWRTALEAGRPYPVPVAPTILDGQQLPAPGDLAFAVVRQLVRDVVGVQDRGVLAAMKYLFERQKLVVEPSGASALAALMTGLVDVRGLRVGVILSGGNVAADRFGALMSHAG